MDRYEIYETDPKMAYGSWNSKKADDGDWVRWEDIDTLQSQLANALEIIERTNSDMLELNGKLQELEGMKKFIIESAEKLKGGADEN